MRLTRLRAQHLRIFDAFDLEPVEGVNVLVGPNGAGKTSVLEAIFLLGFGRSFRAGPRDIVVQRGADALQVYAELASASGEHRLGLQRSSGGWEARLDGQSVAALSELFACCAVVLFEPGSHALIAGEAELRRRFVDWGLFHVEQRFMPSWRRYQRALRQRNALLRSGAAAGELLPWERELASAGGLLHELRLSYLQGLQPALEQVAAAMFPVAAAVRFDYSAGWRVGEVALDQALSESRERDLSLGYTTVGPHRANWQLRIPAIPERHGLSRGQEKLAALCCLMAQASQYAERRGEWPVVCLDDLGSELDQQHQELAIAWLLGTGAQVLITGTQSPVGERLAGRAATFHVEQGQVRRLL